MAAGVSPKVMRQWMARGKREPHSIYGEFRSLVLEAESSAETRAVKRIYKADPALLLKMISARYPDRWAAQYKFELNRMHGIIKQLEGRLDAITKREPDHQAGGSDERPDEHPSESAGSGDGIDG